MSNAKAIVVYILVFLTWALIPQAVRAEPYTTIVNSGDSANRLDIVILGDGYTSAEMGKYRSDAQSFVDHLFAQTPFSTYKNYINVHRIDVESAESGASQPDAQPTPIVKNTALSATYDCGGTARLICINESAANSIVAASVAANQQDLKVVIVNDTRYGGSSSGSYAEAAKQGLAAVRELDAVVRNVYAGNDAEIAAWESASHVEHAPQRAQEEKEEPPTEPPAQS